tara:strand:+ start:1218 stop:2276 length:1059 start_codon:yes stop_codon:yes gene_type:complete
MAYKFLTGTTVLSGSARQEGEINVSGTGKDAKALNIKAGSLNVGNGSNDGNDSMALGISNAGGLEVYHADGIKVHVGTNASAKLNADGSDWGVLDLRKSDSGNAGVSIEKAGTAARLVIRAGATEKVVLNGSGQIDGTILRVHTAESTVGGLTLSGGDLTVTGETMSQTTGDLTVNGAYLQVKQNAGGGATDSYNTALIIGNDNAAHGAVIMFKSASAGGNQLQFLNGDGSAPINAKANAWGGDGSNLSGTPSSIGQFTYTIKELKTGAFACGVGLNYATASATATLPAVGASDDGKRMRVKAYYAASPASALSITPNGSDTIQGGSIIKLESPYAAVELTYNHANTNWIIG